MRHRSSSTGRSKPSRTRELAHSHSRPCHHILTHARACITYPPSKARPLERTVGCVCAYVRALADMRTSYGTSPSSRCGPNTQPLPTRATAIKLTVHHTTLAATTKRPVSPHVVVARCGYQVDALVIASVCYMRRRLSRQLHRIHKLYSHFKVSKHLVCLATRLKLDSDDLCRPSLKTLCALRTGMRPNSILGPSKSRLMISGASRHGRCPRRLLPGH